MKFLSLASISAAFSLLVAHTACAQLEVGARSEVTSFALFDGNVLSNRMLDDFGGKIVLAFYYTPW